MILGSNKINDSQPSLSEKRVSNLSLNGGDLITSLGSRSEPPQRSKGSFVNCRNRRHVRPLEMELPQLKQIPLGLYDSSSH